MIRLAIADDHPIVRQGLRRIASDDDTVRKIDPRKAVIENFIDLDLTLSQPPDRKKTIHKIAAGIGAIKQK